MRRGFYRVLYKSRYVLMTQMEGRGPINDYGRSLWGAEIASRALCPKKMTDEQIGQASGFFGPLQTPNYFKPHLKCRGLWNKTMCRSSFLLFS